MTIGGIASTLYVTKAFRPSGLGRGLGADFFVIGGTVISAFAVAWLALAMGRGLRRLMPRTRTACIILLTLLLLYYLIILVATWRQNPLASVGGALCMIAYGSALGLLLWPSTAAVFAADYRDAVTRSPSLMPRLGFVGMVATGVDLSLFVGGIAIIVIDAIRSSGQ